MRFFFFQRLRYKLQNNAPQLSLQHECDSSTAVISHRSLDRNATQELGGKPVAMVMTTKQCCQGDKHVTTLKVPWFPQSAVLGGPVGRRILISARHTF